MMKVNDLVQTLKSIATDYKTLYVYGGIGGHLRSDNYERYLNKYEYNRQASRKSKILASLDKGVFGFDCICLIKSVLWGWRGDLDASYGGAVYKSGGVPDVNADKMLDYCTEVSEDFSTLQKGEFLWLKGHCGIYVGDGLAVECTPAFCDGVQITQVANLGLAPGEYNLRKWTKHGFLSFVDYTTEEDPLPDDPPSESVTPPPSDFGEEPEEEEAPIVAKTGVLQVILRILRLLLDVIRSFFGE